MQTLIKSKMAQTHELSTDITRIKKMTAHP